MITNVYDEIAQLLVRKLEAKLHIYYDDHTDDEIAPYAFASSVLIKLQTVFLGYCGSYFSWRRNAKHRIIYRQIFLCN